MSQVLGISWYRFRTTWLNRRSGYLSIVLLVALLGGLALAAIAGARTTQSSYPTYLASTNPSDMNVITAVLNPSVGNGSGYDAAVTKSLTRVPDVTRVASAAGLDIEPVRADGSPIGNAEVPVSAGNGVGSVNAEGFGVDRLSITAGRMPEPSRSDEFVTTAAAARAFGFHIGQKIHMGIYTNAQTELSGFGTAQVRPTRTIEERLVGTVVVPTSLVEDDVDANAGGLGYFTPSLTHRLLGCCANYSSAYLQIRDPARNLAAVEAKMSQVLPGLSATVATTTTDTLAKAERAVRPESIALGVFGGIAALAALLIAGQVIGRQIRLGSHDREVLRALGASPAMAMTEGLLGVLGAVVAGSILAVVLAVALSPLAPLGPVRSVYPRRGVSFDWTVLCSGLAALVVVLSAIALVTAYTSAPHRTARRAEHLSGRTSGVVLRAGALGLPASAVTGIGFALEPGSGRNTVPVRSAILGAGLAAMVVTTTIVFGSSLNTLVTTPRLFGWNWTYMLSGGSGSGDIPAKSAAQLLDRDRDVAAWSGAYFATAVVDGQTLPVMGERPGTSVQPPVLSGHDLGAADQVVLGTLSLSRLHKHLGEWVTMSGPTGSSVKLRIVGTATMPTVGLAQEQHLEMGTGALLASEWLPPVSKNPFNDPLTGPEAIFLTMRPGANPAIARKSLEQIAAPLSNTANFGVALLSVQRPAEIVDYRSLGSTPLILGSMLGLGVVCALMLTLFASVRRRRRDFALVKALGFVRSQLAATVCWQATVAVTLGLVVGLPLGIIVGKTSWDLFAGGISAVPAVSIPPVSLILLTVGALTLANLVAVVPGRLATSVSTEALLRSE